MAIKTAVELAEKCKDVAENYKTLYVMGCFGAPMTASNKTKYIAHHSYNRKATRTAMIKNATADTFGFDCVNLIKGLLWGWNGNKSASHGGAKYATGGVPDTNADGMIKLCKDVSTDFSSIQVGEAVWMPGHIGVYIGNGLAVECTPAWKNCVQITAVHNIGKKAGYNGRKWTKHGKLPYVEYNSKATENAGTASSTASSTATATTSKKATDAARCFWKSLAGSYKVTASALNVRNGAGITKKIMVAIPKGTKVNCYGYYTSVLGTKWLYIQFTYKGVTYSGFASSKYLAK